MSVNEVLQFLQEAKAFILATMAGDRPRTRPFGFVMEYRGKLCFCTNNKKACYDEMQANPNVEICAMVERKWIRVSGKAVYCTDADSQAQALALAPVLASMYQVGDGKFEIFYLDGMLVESY